MSSEVIKLSVLDLLPVTNQVDPFEGARKAVTSRTLDFWCLGGASILVWAAIIIGGVFRQKFVAIDQHFSQLTATFGILSLLCNYPHFIVSYRIGYSKGWRFILRHW